MDVAPVGVGKEIPPRLVAQVQAQERKVDVEKVRVDFSGKAGLHKIPVLMGKLGQLDFGIGVGTLRNGVKALFHKEILQCGDKIVRYEHHAGHGHADDAVQGDQNRERDQGPQAAGHGVHALFPVQLLHFGIQLLLVPFVAALQFLDLRLQAGGTHHALLALRHEGGEDQVHREGKEDDR